MLGVQEVEVAALTGGLGEGGTGLGVMEVPVRLGEVVGAHLAEEVLWLLQGEEQVE